MYMYKQANDALPTTFWILNEGKVNILPLDLCQELIEGQETNSTKLHATFFNENDVFKNVPKQKGRIRNRPYGGYCDAKSFKDINTQLLVELSDDCGLILRFSSLEDSSSFQRDLFDATKFQVLTFLLPWSEYRKCCFLNTRALLHYSMVVRMLLVYRCFNFSGNGYWRDRTE